MNDELVPRRVCALFPFAVAARPASMRQADLCRGFACFVEKQLSRLNGVEVSLQHFLVAPESNPERRGWLMTNHMWTVDQFSTMPFPLKERLTHVFQGEASWKSDEFHVTIELIDFRMGDVVYRGSVSGHPDKELPEFFTMLGAAARRLMNSDAAERLLAQPATTSAGAFEDYLRALAARQAYAHKMAEPQPVFAYLIRAMRKDPEFTLACETMESFINRCFDESGAVAEAALRALERVQSSPAVYPRFHAMLGIELEARGEKERALELLERYIKAESMGQMPSRAMTVLARIYRERSDHRRTRDFLESAVRANSENAAAWEELGNCYIEEGALSRAEECWRRALAADPDRPGSLIRLADAYYRRRDYPRARRLYEEGLQRNGEDQTQPLVRFLDCLLRLDELEEADETATAWVEREGECVEAWYWTGLARRHLGEREAVLHCARRIREIARTEAEAERSRLLEFALDHPRTFESYRDALENVLRDEVPVGTQRLLERIAGEHPDVTPVWRLLVRVYEQHHEVGKAADAQREVVRLCPAELGELHKLGELQLAAGRAEGAITTLRRALEMPDHTIHTYRLLGRAYEEASHPRDALEIYVAAAVRDPKDETLAAKVVRLRQDLEPKDPETAPGEPPKIERPDGGVLRLLRRFLRM